MKFQGSVMKKRKTKVAIQRERVRVRLETTARLQVIEYLKDHKISKYELGKRLGLSKSVLYRLLDPKRDPVFSSIAKIAAVLGCTVAELIEEGSK